MFSDYRAMSKASQTTQLGAMKIWLPRFSCHLKIDPTTLFWGNRITTPYHWGYTSNNCCTMSI